jgi:hypothetical protein
LTLGCKEELSRENPSDKNGTYYVDFTQIIKAELIIKEDFTPYIKIDASQLLVGTESYLKCFNDSFIFTKEKPINEILLSYFVNYFNKNLDSVGLAPFTLSNGLEKDFKIKIPVNKQIFKVIDSIQYVDLYNVNVYYNTQRVKWINVPITIEGDPGNLPLYTKGIKTIDLKKNTFPGILRINNPFGNSGIALDSASFSMFKLNEITNENIHNPHFTINYNPALLVEGCKIIFIIDKDPNLWQTTSKVYTYDDLKNSNSISLNGIYLKSDTKYNLKYKLDSLNSSSPPIYISNFTTPQAIEKQLNNFKPAIEKGEIISCFTINNVCYAMSSIETDFSSAGKIFKYSQTTDSWEQLNVSVPYGLKPVVYAKDYVVFVFLAYINENPQCYSFDGNTFKSLPDFPAYFTDGITFSVGNDAYLQASNYAASKIIYKYSSISNSWTQVADMPSARIFSFSFALNNKAYVCAGKNTGFFLLKDMICYSPETNSWTTISGDFSNWDFGSSRNNSFVYNNCAILFPPNSHLIGKTFTEKENYDYIEGFSIINSNASDYARKFRFIIDDYYYLMIKADSQTELSYTLTKTKI